MIQFTHGGLDLFYPSVPQSQLSANFHGFPVMSANIDFPSGRNLTSRTPPGYASLFGWIQFYNARKPSQPYSDGDWHVDMYDWAADLNSPFVTWGPAPPTFDAPARTLEQSESEGGQGLIWRAQTFSV